METTLDILISSLAITLLLSPILLTLLAIAHHSWLAMWCAALGSLLISIPAWLSFGPLTSLLFCLQAPAALALRRANTSRREWTILMLLGILAWTIIIPVPVLAWRFFGWHISNWFSTAAIVGVLGLLLPYLPIDRLRSQRSSSHW